MRLHDYTNSESISRRRFAVFTESLRSASPIYQIYRFTLICRDARAFFQKLPLRSPIRHLLVLILTQQQGVLWSIVSTCNTGSVALKFTDCFHSKTDKKQLQRVAFFNFILISHPKQINFAQILVSLLFVLYASLRYICRKSGIYHQV